MYCTGFHSHSASHTGSRPWCGGACLAGRPPICASSVPLFLVLFARSATMQTRSFSVVGPCSNLEWNSNRSKPKAPPKRCLFSIPAPSQDCSFPLGLWVDFLKGRYIYIRNELV